MTSKELCSNICRKKTFLCVGLDPDMKKMPPHLLSESDPIFTFNKSIIDATANLCVAYKLNIAFYECKGLSGWQSLEKTVSYIRNNYPDQFLIADAKRGDIGNTSEMYARTFFQTFNFDAVTVAPYMGEDSVKPFVGHKDKWVILLALTSNSGANDFQFMQDEQGERLFEKVVKASQGWGTSESMMYVVGATQSSMFADIRKIAPDNFLLVPGIGYQGGDLYDVCKYGMNDQCGLLVNSSRQILYAGNDLAFMQAASHEARKIQADMEILLRRKKLID